MSDSSLFDQFDLLLLEENEVHFLGLENVYVAVGKSGLVECTFVLIVVYEDQILPKGAANALDLFLIVVLHFSLPLVLCDEIHQLMNLVRHLGDFKDMTEMASGYLSPHEVPDLVDFDVRVGGSDGLSLALEVVQELHA